MNQYDPLTSFLLPIFLALAVKSTMYFFIFKMRNHKAALLTCVILGGALIIPSGFVGLPPLLGFAAGIGIAFVVVSKYTEVPILYEGLVIIFSIEIGYAFLERLIIAPLVY